MDLQGSFTIGTMNLRASHAGDLAQAAEMLRRGGTVAFPTETVYGLGANALDRAAVAKIFAAKQRPAWDPLIVHVDGPAMLERVALLPTGAAGRACERLMEACWPGPLTLLLPRTQAVPDAVTAGRGLVGVRTPAHAIALELIRQASVPVAAPSANRFGHTSPTTAEHVLADLEGRIDAVLDGGATTVGVESTVFDVEAMTIYRPGAVTAEMIAPLVGGEVRTASATQSSATPRALASPGMGMRHYAPRARLVLVGSQAELSSAIDDSGAARVGVMLPDGWDPSCAAVVYRWGAWEDKQSLARRLFAGLRELDQRGASVIVCPVPEMGGIGEAIRDRLQKAARVK